MSWHLWLYKKLFAPPVPEVVYVDQPVYRVVEVPAGRTPRKWTKETRDSVATLMHHPGFLALVERLALQRSMLESKLAREYRKDLRENDWLQAGVFWLDYISTVMDQATATPRTAQRDAMEEELEAFKAIDATIERIGMDTETRSNA